MPSRVPSWKMKLLLNDSRKWSPWWNEESAFIVNWYLLYGAIGMNSIALRSVHISAVSPEALSVIRLNSPCEAP